MGGKCYLIPRQVKVPVSKVTNCTCMVQLMKECAYYHSKGWNLKPTTACTPVSAKPPSLGELMCVGEKADIDDLYFVSPQSRLDCKYINTYVCVSHLAIPFCALLTKSQEDTLLLHLY